jgi:DNA-binding GntR family transcriptional regulator
MTTRQEVRAQVEERIRSGEFAPGDRLPSIRVLASLYRASPGTVRAALNDLDQVGLIAGPQGGRRIVQSVGGTPLRSSADLAVDRIEQEFLDDGRLTDGPLPTETTLCSVLGVSRASLRAALGTLVAEGILIRHPDGRLYSPGAVPDTAYNRVAQQMRSALPRPAAGTGHRLPGESQLAAQYRVSRPTVRRALSVLAQEGLVYSVPKVGWFVSGSRRR